MNLQLQMHKNLILMFVFLFFSVAYSQVPNEPTNLVVTPINTGGMIQFTAPSSIGGSAITNYEYSINNGEWVTPSPAITASPLIISGLTNCTTYQVKLRAVNAVGASTASEAILLTPLFSNGAGINWIVRANPVDNAWSGITYANGLFVAVGNSSSGDGVMTSPDGIIWTARTTPVNNEWFGITYGNGLFVAVAISGIGNRVMTSPDGITWTARITPADNNWISVTYGNGLFVAVAFSGVGNRVMTSPDGINWTIGISPADNNWFGVTYGNGLFVAIAQTGSGNRVMTSPDGISWTIRTSAVNNTWRGITYGNGLFVAVSFNGTTSRVMTSPNGIDWTARLSAANNNWNSVSYGNGIFAAVSSSGSGNRVMTSLDGSTWTIRASAENNYWNSITYGNGHFVAVAPTGTGNRVMTSSFSVVADAPVITSATLGTSTSVNFTQSSSALATAITNYEYSTENGSNWTAVSPAATTSPLTITGLPDGTSSIMIRAVNSVGSSCPSQNYLNNYMVIFDANEGIGSMATQTIAYTNSTNLTANAFTRSGYTFAGWATTSTGAVAYANSASYTMGNANVTLFAKWTATSSSNGTTTQLRSMHCGKTLRWLDEKIQASPISGVTQYRFEVIRTDDALDSRIATTNNYLFNPATQLAGGLIYGKSYYIRVKTFIGTTENPYGNTCIVTAPAEPICCTVTKLRPFQCGATLLYMTQPVEATPVYKATTYEFEVTSAAGTFVKSSPNYTFSLYYSVPGRALYGTAYSIRVRSKGAATEFTAYGDPCVVRTPIARMSDPIESDSIFNVKAFPNPFASHFSVDIESSSDALVELKVYDMLGRHLEANQATVSELSVLEVGRNYPSGVYNVVVSQGDKVKSLRMIKR